MHGKNQTVLRIYKFSTIQLYLIVFVILNSQGTKLRKLYLMFLCYH